MQRRAMRLKKIPVTFAATELSPRAATGMTVGRDIAQPEPAPIATGGIGTEMLRGVDVTAAASCRSHRWGWRRWWQPCSLDCLLTSSTTGFTGETLKGLRLFGALAPGQQRLGWYWASCSRLRWPQPIEHQEHPHQGDQPELVEHEMRDHGTAPSYKE